jgi:demethylmenaquinone methyltransferase / 2-methoxy-6-polyprenyl-1,4-benzoquinol methylase
VRRTSSRELREVVSDPLRKQEFVTAMFNVIAPRYDDFTRVFSFGMDARWKNYILARITTSTLQEGTALDLACGTGDLSFALAAMQPSRTVAGIDAAALMLTHARERAGNNGNAPQFIQADIMQLPVKPDSVALVTAGYAFRNVPDYQSALRQLADLMQPGALLVTLDFYRPASLLWRSIFLNYLAIAGKTVGWLWHRSPEVYEYIAHSISAFATTDQFTDELEKAGFAVEHEKRWLGGGVVAHFARRLAG